ncbi:heparan-sulfate lyase [Porphyromonadaceae bacterium KHP3R9]|nr:heparan-sulfate lyase [Porphyromonadaceae bacterium KHP3R9]
MSKTSLVILLHLFALLPIFGKQQNNLQSDKCPSEKQSVECLLEKLDLPAALEKEILQSKEREKQGAVLLDYFRSRRGIHHPVKREDRIGSLGNLASKADIEMADDALKHIFVGQPAYPRFFCGDDIDWGARPVPDDEWVWQLNRMYFWNAMDRAYWHTGDERYARAWGEQLIDWVRKNPYDEEHSYAWRSIETGIRGNSWCELYQRFIDSPSFTPEVLIHFLNSLHDHATLLMIKYTTNSNWALMEAEGLAFIAILFPEFKESPAWRSEAFRRLNVEIDKQVYPDGHQRELAMGYHVGCISWFLRSYELAKMNGLAEAFPRSYEKKIEKMCEVPMKLCHPDGTVVQFGDAWTGEPGQYKSRFMAWSKLFNREDFLYMATGGAEGKAPAERAFALPESGLYSMRSSWERDAIFLALKCGPDGGGHSQPDNGTFGLYAGGRILMPDAGSYIYSGDWEGRAWFRQTKVHQTLTLDDRNSAYAPALLKWECHNDLDLLVVENRSYDDLTHRRSVLFVDKRYFVIIDEAYGSAAGDVELHFQLAPGEPIVDKKRYSIETSYPEGWNLFLKCSREMGEMELREEEGWVSHVYTVKEPRSAFCFHVKKNGREKVVRYVTLLLPYNGVKPDIRVKLLNESADRPLSNVNLEITEYGQKKWIGYTL